MPYDWENWGRSEVAHEGGRRWIMKQTGAGWVWGSEDADDLDTITVMNPEPYASRWACIQAVEAAIARHLEGRE